MSILNLLKWEFRLISPTAVNAPERHLEIDLPVAVDGVGDPYIPASSVAGSLRSHLGNEASRVMGPTPEEGETATLVPSALSILGTSLSGDIFLQATKRSAVDRMSGSAADRMLYDSQALAPGAHLTIYAITEAQYGTNEDELGEGLNAETIELLSRWQPILGSRRTTGQGQTESTGFRSGCLNLTEAADLETWLTLGGPQLINSVATTLHSPSNESSTDSLGVRFTVVDQLHIGTGAKRPAEPAPIRRNSAGQAVMPGSAWKGVIRSRMMFIIESVSPGRCANTGGVTTNSECDCPACLLFGTTERRGLLTFTDSIIDNATVEEQTHVAIDRFTGGATDKRLWKEQVITSGELDFNVETTGRLDDAHSNLLSHVVRDLHDGLIGIGGRTSRGAGTIAVAGDPPPVRPVTSEDLT
jgi:CRISPR/Cas system CSM-associated protein Csm3 (group 7 of RAMP superfamily)